MIFKFLFKNLKMSTTELERDDPDFNQFMSKMFTAVLALTFFVCAPITFTLILEIFTHNIFMYYLTSLFIHCFFLYFISATFISAFKRIDLDPTHPMRKYRISPLTLFEAQEHYKELAPSFFDFYKWLIGSTAAIYTFFFWSLYFTDYLAPAYIPITFSSLFFDSFMLACTFITTDFWYYTLHRLYHHPLLYKHLHKVHHEYYNVTVLTSFHSSIIEYIFFDIPIYNFGWLSLLYFGYPIHTSLISLSSGIILVEQLLVHSGYFLPFGIDKTVPYLADPRFHFHHHKMNKGSFGALFSIFDRLFGSYNLYKEKHT